MPINRKKRSRKVKVKRSRKVKKVVNMQTIVQFYSKSKSDNIVLAGDKNWRRYLSNFQMSPFKYNGKVFPSVEHAFAYAKYKYSVCNQTVPDFTINGPYSATSNIKSIHSKRGMTARNCTLDIVRFAKVKKRLMTYMLKARAKSDEHFRNILKDARKHNYYLLHFARGGGAGWGGYISKKDGKMKGDNFLGKIMMKLKL